MAGQVKAARLAGSAVLLVLAVCVYTYPLVLRASTEFPYNSGDPAYVTWHMMWNWRALTGDVAGLADTNILYPVRSTTFFSELVLPPAVPFGIVWAVTGNPILAANVLLMLSLVLDAAAFALLAYRWTGDWVAAVAAALVGAFNPILLPQTAHPQMVMLWWAPMALLAATSYVVRPRLWTGLATIICIWLQFLTSPYVAFYAAFLVGAFLVAELVRHRRRWLGWCLELRSPWPWIHASVFGLVILALFVPPVSAYQEVARVWGAERDLGDVGQFSARPSDFLSVDRSSLYSAILPSDEGERRFEKRLWPGLVPPMLAVAAVVTTRTRPSVEGARIWAAIACVALGYVMALGPRLAVPGWPFDVPLPYQLFYDVLPGFRAMRVPARFGLLAVAGLAILAAYGVAAVRRSQRAPRVAGLVLVALLAAESGRFPLPTSPLVEEFDDVDRQLVDRARGPMAWLPLNAEDPLADYREIARMVHNRNMTPMINGYSGLYPPTYRDLRNLASEEPPETVGTVLAMIGVETVVLDADYVSAREIAAWRTLGTHEAGHRLEVVRLPERPGTAQGIRLEIPNRTLPAGRNVHPGLVLVNESATPWISPQLGRLWTARATWLDHTGRVAVSEDVATWIPTYVPGSGVKPVTLPLRSPALSGSYQLSVAVDGSTAVLGPITAAVDVVGTSVATSGAPGVPLLAEREALFHGASTTAQFGGRLRISGSFLNAGEAVWMDSPSERGPVRIGYRWFRESPDRQVGAGSLIEGRIPIGYDVHPGGRARFDGQTRVPAEVGDYWLQVGPVAEGVTWIPERNGRDGLRISVVGPGA
jgi:hypothetical protein